MKYLLGSLTLALVGSLARGDTPANCTYMDIAGSWTFLETARTGDSMINCDVDLDIVYTKNFVLSFPDIVTDELGNVGKWTLVYNQGFEVNINERSYFAFSYYEGAFAQAVSYCDQVFNGWSRDKTVRNWSCFSASKDTPVPPRVTSRKIPSFGHEFYKNDLKMIEKINKMQTSWKAKEYPEWERYTIKEMFARAGGPVGAMFNLPPTSPATSDLKARVSLFPESFDWRDVEGVDYVSPVRDQEGCGSCYAFASMANVEAQLRIVTRNQRQDVFSPQDPVSCSYLAQGCNGGFDYLIAGRYGMEKGFVWENCNPYNGNDDVCWTVQSCGRTYISEYEHVGGYYGACSEEAMIETLVTHGPISVSFEVYDDFHNYESGIYHHTYTRNEFNPFEKTNHVVLIVGYGVDELTGEKFWTVKNSWGETFGLNGYFKIRRGTSECGIESMAVTVTVIP